MATAFPSDESGAVQIYDVVTCFICKKHTSSQLIQLKCFHICHKSCLKRSLRNARPGSRFSCSECKTISLVPPDGVEGFPDELLQYKLKKITSMCSNTPSPCKICEKLGDESMSTHYCITCKMHLCSTDTKRHALQPDHKIITNDDIQTEQYLPKLFTTKKALCLPHSTDDSAKILEFYCEECQVDVCQVCCVIKHKTHKTITIQEASHKFKEELKKIATEIPNKKSQCEFVIDRLEKLLNEIETNSKQQIDKCQKWGEYIKRTVDKIVNRNVQNIEKTAETQRNEIIKIKKERRDQNNQVQSAKNYMEIFLKFGSESDFLQKYNIFQENINICLWQNTKVKITVEKPKMKSNDKKEIEKILEELLKVETVNENHQISHPQLRGFHLESKWQTFDRLVFMTGIAVDSEDILAVKGKVIEVYGMAGQDRGGIYCQGVGTAWDIEVVGNQLFISDMGKRVILVLDREGNIKRKVALPAQEHGVLFLAVNPTKGDIYISSESTNTVYKCAEGQTMANPFITTGLSGPRYLCVTSTSGVIVSNNRSHTVCKYTSEGELVWKYGRPGPGEGELDRPAGVCVDFMDQVFVCDSSNHRIHHLTPGGKFLSFINIEEKIEYPQAITFSKDKVIIISNTCPNQIFVIKCNYI